MGASGKWTQKSHPMRENNVSASSCVQLFACWLHVLLSHHVSGEQFLSVHMELRIGDGEQFSAILRTKITILPKFFLCVYITLISERMKLIENRRFL